MFGQNPKRASVAQFDGTLQIQEIFPTFQGEGPYTGEESIFVRLGGCNLACDFCDTEFESYSSMPLDLILQTVDQIRRAEKINLVVITGGEPFRQPIEQLCEKLIESGYRVQIETNGTLFRDVHQDVHIVCSPKSVMGRYYPIRPDLLSRVDALKFVISKHRFGYTEVPEIIRTDKPIYIQAMDEYDEVTNKENFEYAIDMCIAKNYKLSVQMHKIYGVR